MKKTLRLPRPAVGALVCLLLIAAACAAPSASATVPARLRAKLVSLYAGCALHLRGHAYSCEGGEPGYFPVSARPVIDEVGSLCRQLQLPSYPPHTSVYYAAVVHGTSITQHAVGIICQWHAGKQRVAELQIAVPERTASFPARTCSSFVTLRYPRDICSEGPAGVSIGFGWNPYFKSTDWYVEKTQGLIAYTRWFPSNQASLLGSSLDNQMMFQLQHALALPGPY